MRLLPCPLLIITILAVPAGALALSQSPLAQHATVAVVVLWLAGLGWGFQALLHRRLAAEDRLARLEAKVALERDAYQALRQNTQARTTALAAAWLHLQMCLCDGDGGGVAERMHALQEAIVQLQEPA